MMRQLLLVMPGNEAIGARLATALEIETTPLETRRFPDGESYLRFTGDVAGAELVVVCTLAAPDPQFLGLVFAARTARELGVAKLTLVAPYLAYMRQDKPFHPGEAVTSTHFARLLSQEFDRIVTVDPHLHRRKTLSEIYSIPAEVVHAAPALAAWIKANVAQPLVIGPDVESEQWVSKVAEGAGAPAVVLRKERFGDRDVRISLPDLQAWRGRTPVLVDDIVSSGRTMIEATQGLIAAGFVAPVCVGVHALFAQDAYQRLAETAQRVVSTDAVPHPSNEIYLADLLSAALRG